MNNLGRKLAKQHEKVILSHVKEAKRYETWQEKYFSGQYGNAWNMQKEWREHVTELAMVGSSNV